MSKKMTLSSKNKIMMDFACLEEDKDRNICKKLVLVRGLYTIILILVINYIIQREGWEKMVNVKCI